MEYTLTIKGDNPSDLMATLLSLNGQAGATTTASNNSNGASGMAMPAETTKKRRSAQTQSSEEPEQQDAETVSGEEITREQVRVAATKQIQGGKRAGVAALLKDCGAASLSELAPAKYAYFLEKVNAL